MSDPIIDTIQDMYVAAMTLGRQKALSDAIERLEGAWENDHPTTLPWGVADKDWAVDQLKAMLKEESSGE